MSYTEYLRFWFEQSGISSGQLVVLFLTAVILSPLPRLLIVFSAIRIGFNGFPGKFVSLALALTLSIVQLEPTFTPVVKATKELGRSSLSAEQRAAFLTTVETQWVSYIDSKISPRFKEIIGKTQTSLLGDSFIGRKAVSFLLSELDRAFRAALVIILPLLILELLVATSISALDMKIETELISFPLKLALFLSTSGWELITETLLKLN